MSADKPQDLDEKLELIEEKAVVSLRRVAGERVRVSTITLEHDELINEKLEHQRVEIERVPIGRIVDTVPAVREEGDVTIFPVVEEVLVIERRLVLKEEVHIRRVRLTEQHNETVTLREQEAEIVRSDAEQTPIDASMSSPIAKPVQSKPVRSQKNEH